MSTKLFPALLALILIFTLCSGCSTDDPSTPPVSADVNGYLSDLPTWTEFSPPLESVNEMIDEPVDSEEVHDGLEYNCTTTNYSITETPREITVFSPDSEIMWLGSLLQGSGYSQGLGSLGELPVRQRAPLTVFIDLLTEDVTRTIDNPDPSSVASAVGDLIQLATDSGHVAGSSITFDQKITYSLEQAALDLGISVNYLGTQVQSSLSYDRLVTENTLTAYFTQKMFTVSVVLPQTPGAFFSSEFTQARLSEQVQLGRLGPDNPPTFISNIVYGRMLMLTMTSSHTEEEMRAALSATRAGIGSGSVSGEHLAVLDESRIKISTVGGVDEGVEGLITSGNLRDYFDADAPLTAARPLSYTVRNLADNSIATVSETTDYAIHNCAPEDLPITGARYSLTVDKLRVIEVGCDGVFSPAPEVYYNFVLHRDSGNTTVANRPASQRVTVEVGGEIQINSNQHHTSLYADGRGTMRLTGTAWDYDAVGADDVIGTWNLPYTYGLSNGQRYYTRSEGGCTIRLYVTINKIEDLYD